MSNLTFITNPINNAKICHKKFDFEFNGKPLNKKSLKKYLMSTLQKLSF